jgi:hypothetical protein
VVNICEFGANIQFKKMEQTNHSLIHVGDDYDDNDDIFDFAYILSGILYIGAKC